MAAPLNNKYTVKWEFETAEQFFNDSLELVKNDTSIKYIGTLAVAMDQYRDIYTYLSDKFKVFRTIKKKIDSILESRVTENALDGKTNATFSIFHLKNNHGWKDKQEHDLNVSDYKVIEPKPDED